MIKKSTKNGYPASKISWWQKVFTGWDWQKVVLAILTTIIGVWQFRLQYKLKEEVVESNLVNQMLGKIEKYLENPNIGLDEDKKAIILISLTKLVTEAHLEETGGFKTDTQKNLVRQIPLYFALLSQNDDMLVSIGSKPDDLDLWDEFAKQTSNPEIKIRAAEALERIFFLTREGNNRLKIISHLINLNPPWQIQNSELDYKLQKITVNVIDNLDKEEVPLSKDGKKPEPILDEIKQYFDQRKLRQARTPEEIAKDQTQNQFKEPEIIQAVRKKLSVEAEDQLLSNEQKKTKQIGILIDDLKDDQTNKRRSARSKLASLGQKAVPQLLTALQNEGNVYRIRLGVVIALLLMDQPVMIPSNKVDSITKLLGDFDGIVRINTANFLIKLTYPETQEKVVDSLIENLKNLENPNSVYNSVVVLGQLKRKVPQPISKKIETKLIETKRELDKDRTKWKNTINQINVVLNR